LFIVIKRCLACVHIFREFIERYCGEKNVFDTARWKYTRHHVTEEDIHINCKRVVMTERMMVEVLINELDNMLQITRESRSKLMNDIGQSLKCEACSETFKLCSKK